MILDTHAWVFYAVGRRLDRKALRRIERARTDGQLRIAAVTLWEVALLAQEGRLRFSQPAGEWMEEALERTEVRVAPLDATTAIAGARLFHVLRDPADCQIVGTALHSGVPLATRDGRIVESAKGMGLEVVEI